MRAVVERITQGRVSGWACDDENPEERLVVRLLIERSVVKETRAENFRQDLLRNGVGDGRYGYVITADHIERILESFLSGQLIIEVENSRGLREFAKPVDGLRGQVREAVFLENMEKMELGDFLKSITSTLFQASSEDAARLLRILNASRAHFPCWDRSFDFVTLAARLAAIAKFPHTLSFYKRLMHRLEHALEETSIKNELLPPVPCRSTYASLSDWIADRPVTTVSLVHPRWPSFGPAANVSFLEEVGLLVSEEPHPDSIPVLAFREYAFGDFTWYVTRLGKREPAARNLYYLDFEQLRSVVDKSGVVVIDASNEGAIAESFWIELLNEALRRLEVPISQVLYVSFNLRFGAQPTKQCAFNGYIEHANYFVSSGISVIRGRFPSDQAIREHCNRVISDRAALPPTDLRHYICMNFTPRWARWIVVLHLSLYDLLKKGFVSFPGKTNSKIKDEAREFNQLERSIPNVNGRDELLAHIPAFLAKCPLTLDVESDREQPPDFEFPLELFTRSMLHLVTETHVTWGIGSHSVTEKILKPIVGLQPFVVVGNPGSLELLRELGFRTFGKLVDENYDTIRDPAKRLDAIFLEIDRVTGQPIEELRSTVSDMTEVFVHNFVHLLSNGSLLFGPAVENRLRRTICQMRNRA